MKDPTRQSSRRRFVRDASALAIGALTMTTMRRVVADDHLPTLDPAEIKAQLYGYVERSQKPDARCVGCKAYRGGGDAPRGECNVIPGRLVAADGWCRAWASGEKP